MSFRNWDWFILSIAALNMFSLFYTHREKILARYDIEYWQREFAYSQVIVGDKAKHFFSDGELYSILGYKYLMGDNPIRLHPEVPPLGKIIIGVGIYLFSSDTISIIVLSILCLVLLYSISLEVIPSSTFASLVVLTETFDTQFRELAVSPNLDIPQLLFLLASTLFFMRSLRKEKHYTLSLFLAGLMMATKFYLNGLLLIATFFIILLLKQDFRSFMSFVISLPGAVLGYLTAYTQSLLANPNLLEFLKFQRWLTNWWAGNARVPWGGIYSIIYSNRWFTWWGNHDVIQIPAWNPLWPLLTTLGILAILPILKARHLPALVIWVWSCIYLLFLATTSPFPRYLVAVFPQLGLLSVYFWFKAYSRR